MKRIKEQTPRKSSIIAIMKTIDIDRIRYTLWDNPREILLFDMSIQTGLFMKDLLQLKVSDLLSIKVGQAIPVTTELAKPSSVPIMNQILYKSFQHYLERLSPKPDDYLFKSRKGGHPLTVSSASNMIKKWYQAAGLKGLSGASSLRETWRVHFRNHNQTKARVEETQHALEGLKAIKSTTLSEMVYQQLLSAIISGKIPPGGKLVTDAIAQRLNVSPMPVRQAILKLESTGFVSTKKKRGSIIKELSPNNLEEILELRLYHESFAARKACLNLDSKTLINMQKIHQEYVEAKHRNDVDEYLKLNKKFHFLLYDAADAPILREIINGLWNKVSPYLHLLFREVKGYHLNISIDCHKQILDGLQKRDPDQVAKWLRADLTRGAEMLIQTWKKKKGYK